MAGMAHATLTTIGTVTYDDGFGASDYNLIWDDDNNGNSVVWLDYTNDSAYWQPQMDWAAGLDANLTYNIDASFAVTWVDAAWRLPSTIDGPGVFGYDGTTTDGYNITSSEMGHLWYDELGNLGYYATDGTNPQPGWGLNNTGDFENLIESWYWSSTVHTSQPSTYAWDMTFYTGQQHSHWIDAGYYNYGLAIRTGDVSLAGAPVPEPCTIFLLGSGLLGLFRFRKRFQKN